MFNSPITWILYIYYRKDYTIRRESHLTGRVAYGVLSRQEEAYSVDHQPGKQPVFTPVANPTA